MTCESSPASFLIRTEGIQSVNEGLTICAVQKMFSIATDTVPEGNFTRGDAIAVSVVLPKGHLDNCLRWRLYGKNCDWSSLWGHHKLTSDPAAPEAGGYNLEATQHGKIVCQDPAVYGPPPREIDDCKPFRLSFHGHRESAPLLRGVDGFSNTES